VSRVRLQTGSTHSGAVLGKLVYQDVRMLFAEACRAAWIGPVNSDPRLYPERAMHVTAGSSWAGARGLLQLGRAFSWIVAECAAGALPTHGAGLTSFADFSWRERSSARALF